MDNSVREIPSYLPFVGRIRQLDVLLRHLDSSLDGATRFVLISGEPGIGKTRLAEEIVSEARSREMTAVTGRCADYEGSPTYWPIIAATNQLAEEYGAKAVREALGQGAPIVAETVPGIRAILPDVILQKNIDGQQHRFLFFDAFSVFIRKVAEVRPLLFLIENLHWADEGSLLLLEYLCDELRDARFFLVGTYRDTELTTASDLSITIGEMGRQPTFDNLRLPRLSQGDVVNLVTELIGNRRDGSLADSIYMRTEGNPLYVQQIVRYLRERFGDEIPEYLSAETLPFPGTLKLAIQTRLKGLPEKQRSILTAAAALGREFRLNHLSKLAWYFAEEDAEDLKESTLLDDCVDLERAGIIDCVDELGKQYQFSHALFREVVLQTVPSSKLQELHTEVGYLLENYYGSEVMLHAAELSDHCSRSGDLRQKQKLYKYASAAGRDALSRYNYEGAIVHLRRACEARGRTGKRMDEETAVLYVELGFALELCLRTEESIRYLNDAFTFWEGKGDFEGMMRIITLPLWSFSIISSWYYEPHDIFSWRKRALKHCPKDSVDALILEVEANLEMGPGRASELAVRVEQVIGRAGATLDHYTRIRIIWAMVRIREAQGQLTERINLLEQVVTVAEEANDPHLMIIAHHDLVNPLQKVGEMARAETHINTAIALAERFKDRPRLSGLMVSMAVQQVFGDHDFSGACRTLRRALSINPHNIVAKETLAHYGITLGNFTEALRLLDEIEKALEEGSLSGQTERGITIRLLWDRARIWEHTRNRTGVDTALERARKLMPIQVPWMRYVYHTYCGFIALDDARHDEAMKHLLELENIDYLLGMGLPAAIGRIAHGLGDRHKARVYFKQALETNPQFDRIQIEAKLWYADLLLDTADKADLKHARSLIAEGIDTSEKTGARPLLKKLKLLRTRADPTEPLPDGLTTREAEVLRLVSKGLKNGEIGEKLYISLNTVNTHIRNIFNKIGVSNRTETASYAIRVGLAD